MKSAELERYTKVVDNEGLPVGWGRAKLCEVVDINMGQSPPGSSYNGRGDGLPFFQGKAQFGDRYPTVKVWCTEPKKIAKPGDVLISVRAPVGPSNVADCECIIGRGLAALTPLGGIPTEYILFAFRLLEPQLSKMGTGSTFTAIKREILEEIEIDIAPLAEQKRIVAKVQELLTRVNAVRERLAKVQEIMKRFRQSVLSAACFGHLTTDWREKNPDLEPALELLKRIQKERKKRYEEECATAKLEGKRKPKKPEGMEIPDIDETNLPEIPESWRWAHLQNLGELSRGKSKHRPRNAPKLFGGKYPFIQTGDVARSNRFVTSHLQTYNEIGLAQSRLFPENTLCITIAANIGDTAILTYPACFPDSVVGFIPGQGFFEVLFAMYYIRTVQSDLQAFAPATAQRNINLEILHKIAVPMPPLAEQKEIVRRAEALFKIADKIEERYEKAKARVDKLTQSILAKAFRGELVPQDLKDEPASSLLECITAERAKLGVTKIPVRKRRKTKRTKDSGLT